MKCAYPGCNEPAPAHTSSRVSYCSAEHRGAARNMRKRERRKQAYQNRCVLREAVPVCPYPGCDKPAKQGAGFVAIYCSREHSRAAQVIRKREKRQRDKLLGIVERRRKWCEFPGCDNPVRPVSGGGSARYCSTEHSEAIEKARLHARAKEGDLPADKAVMPAGADPRLPPWAFTNDPRAIRDHGSPGNLRAIARLVYASGASSLADI